MTTKQVSYYSKNDDISFTPLTREEEAALFTKFYAGDLGARDEIIKRYLKFVAKESLLRGGKVLPMDEAISAGNAGLIQALETRNFDPAKGNLFASYLRPFVHGKVCEAIREKNQMGQHDPHGASASKRNDCSLEDSVDHDYSELQLNEVREGSIKEAVRHLTEQESAMIKRVYYEGKSMAEAGREIGITREGARKLHNRAMAKLHRVLRTQKSELC
jgi:RNA polymerase sigma factor (sigma-70 family)